MSEYCLDRHSGVRSRTAFDKASLIRIEQSGQHSGQPSSQNPREDLGVAVSQSDWSPVAQCGMVTVRLRKQRQRRGKPRGWRIVTVEDAIEELQKKWSQEGQESTIPLIG